MFYFDNIDGIVGGKKKKDHTLKRCNCRKAWLAVVHALNN